MIGYAIDGGTDIHDSISINNAKLIVIEKTQVSSHNLLVFFSYTKLCAAKICRINPRESLHDTGVTLTMRHRIAAYYTFYLRFHYSMDCEECELKITRISP